jgi:hypothetical protein
VGAFSELYLDPTIGYSNTLGLNSTTSKAGDNIYQVREGFFKVDGEHKKGKLKAMILLQK